MWVIFGAAAIIAAFLNIVWMKHHRETKWFRFISLSFTALTMCAEYSFVNDRVLREDWGALQDVVPSMTPALWFLVIVSIAINGVSLFVKADRSG